MKVQYNIYFGLLTQNNVPVTNEVKGKALDLIISQYASFNVFESFGYWQGVRENCVKIEIVLDAIQDREIKALCENLAVILEQEAVLYTKYDLVSELAYQPKPKPVTGAVNHNLSYEELVTEARKFGLTSHDLRARKWNEAELVNFILTK